MKKFPVADLKPGMSFDNPVYIDGNSILMGSFEPLKFSDYERLKRFKIEFVYTNGKLLDEKESEAELKKLVSGLTIEKGPDISEIYSLTSTNTQEMDTAKKHQEIIESLKKNFELAKQGKNLDVQEVRNGALSILNILEKNRRIVFKLIFSSPYDSRDVLFYNAANTALLAGLTGITLKYSKLQLLNLLIGALLHDIGMVKVPDPIYYKKETLTARDMATLKKHTEHGFTIIRSTNSFSADVLSIITQHHERLDGSGYPMALTEKQISEYAKIVAICDTYQAMCAKREYRDARTPPMIIKTLLKEELGKLDSTIIKAFVYSVGVYPIGTMVKLNNGDIGEVMLQNVQQITKPVVKIYADSQNRCFDPPKLLNILNEKNIEIEKVLSNDESKEFCRKLGRK